MDLRTQLSPALLACLSYCVTLPAQADQFARIREAGKLRIAIASAVPPFNFVGDDKQLTGSDVDSARLLAQDLGVQLEIVRITNSERVTALIERRADLVVSALSITPEREREIAFSVPYARIAVAIAAPHPLKLSSMLDLNGQKVGALAASSNLAHLLKTVPGVQVVTYPENDRMSQAYVAGEFEVMTAPESIVADTNRLKPKRPLVVQFTQMEFDVAIGMPKGEKPMRDWVNQWVVTRLQDRTLANIYHKHHGHKLPDTIIPSAEGKSAR